MRYLFAGGGTGGHIYPALSIAQALEKLDQEAQILFIGSRRGLEKRIIPQYGYDLKFLDVQAFQRRLSFDTLKTVYKAAKSVGDAMSVIAKFRPDIVIGTGGYVSGPPVFAAQLRKIPTVIQEQNALPGVTTKALAKRADCIFVGYAIAEERLATRVSNPEKVLYLGNPIRLDITNTSRADGCRLLGLDPHKFTVLVFGASQGSRAINNTLLSIWSKLVEFEDLQIVWQTGESQFAGIRAQLPEYFTEAESDVLRYSNLQVRPYIHQMSAALAASDIVVSRAGAISLAEITAKGIPSILIPLPTAAENHQEHNARALEKAGAARMILEKELKPEVLFAELTDLFEDHQRRTEMAAASRRLGKPYAAQEIAEQIIRIAAKRQQGTH